jgi:ribosomal 30S subunit maturation factor RimM
VGLSVRDQTGAVRGQVHQVDTDAPQARLLVETPQGVRLVPLVAALVTEISIPGGYLVIEDLPGLLSDPGSGEIDLDEHPAG